MSQPAPDHAAGPRSTLWPLLLLVLLGLSWGLHFPILRFAARSGLPYSGIAATTTSGVALVLLSVAIVRGRFPAFRPRHLRFYAICAVLGYLVPYFLALFAAGRIDAGVLTLITATSPIFTLCLASSFRVERMTVPRILGIGLGAASVAVLILPQADLFGAAALTAIVVAFGIPMSYSSYHIYLTKSWPAGFDSFQVACGEALVAVCLMLPVFLATGGIDIVNADWTAGHWAILATVIITSLDCYLYFEIVRLAGPVFVSQANFVTVIAGVLWGMALHGEKPGHWLWVSVAFLVGSLLMLALGRRSAGVARRVSQTADS